MKKTTKSHDRKISPKKENPVNIIFGLVILAYIIIPNFTPNLMAFDTNAPKFLALAIVNLAAFVTLLSHKKLVQQPASFGLFFRTGPGLVYAGFLAASLLSLFNAINHLESIVQLTKIFTVFSAVFILSMILISDIRYMKWVVMIITALLIFDALSVFYYIGGFIQGDIASIADIKSIYSNKNILASAIFVKLPFALWLVMFRKGWLKAIGWFGLMTGITATFFMATRAFYLGLLALTFVFLAYMLTAYLRKRQKAHLWLAGSYLAALIIAYLAFTGTQRFLYPTDKGGRHAQGVEQQLASIGEFDSSASQRIDAWKWSWKLLKEKPLLGVGSGNWKVAVLKYENRTKADFTYMYKAHNDFIETAAETGFIGGILYLGIFILIGWAFLQMVIAGKNEDDNLFRYMFLAVSGVSFYAVDAFFNFPADRPEILLLFSFYVATAVSVIHHEKKLSTAGAAEQKTGNTGKRLFWPLAVAAIIVMAGIIWVFNLNFQSSKTQRIVYQEIKSGTLKSSSAKIIAGFPFIPDLNIMGESINVQKARYLLSEDKNEEALAVLRADRSSPYDGRREYFMAMGFNNLRMTDSALVYSEKLRQMKPNHAKNTLILCQLYEERKEYEKVKEYLDAYLENNKTYNMAWVYASQFHFRQEDVGRAWDLIEEGKRYFPKDTLVERQHSFIYRKQFVDPYMELYNKAREYFDKKDYSASLTYLDEFIENVPDDFNVRRLRAFTYYYLRKYRESIAEIDYAMTLSDDTGALLINLRGVCYRGLNDMEAACRDFERAMQMGNNDGKSNYQRFCQTKPPA